MYDPLYGGLRAPPFLLPLRRSYARVLQANETSELEHSRAEISCPALLFSSQPTLECKSNQHGRGGGMLVSNFTKLGAHHLRPHSADTTTLQSNARIIGSSESWEAI